MDDVLKSVLSVTDALPLVQKVGDLRGMKPKKFISNTKNILSQISGALRMDDAKEKDLTRSIPTERVLEIF